LPGLRRALGGFVVPNTWVWEQRRSINQKEGNVAEPMTLKEKLAREKDPYEES